MPGTPREFVLPWLKHRITSKQAITTIQSNRAVAYGYFAAARSFQKAYEINGRGVFTQGLTELLAANPTANYTNQEILELTGKFLRQAQLSKDIQEPVFHGPTATSKQIFALLDSRTLHPQSNTQPITTLTPPQPQLPTTTVIQESITPFAIKLWFNAPNQTIFNKNDAVILHYQALNMPYKQAYFTLLNIAPDGTLSVLYPQPHTNTAAIIKPGQIYTIPSSQETLRQKNLLTSKELQIRLTQPGEEYFKAIATLQPLPVVTLSNLLGTKVSSSAELNQKLTTLLQEFAFQGWGEGELRIVVD
jgi:hypothetical protein